MHSTPTGTIELPLAIGVLARRAGVATATLRSWEARYGFPEPARQSGGHRRYAPDQVALVAEVARLRHAGLSVPAAIAAARAGAGPAPESFFASLRRSGRGLQTHLLDKPMLTAVTRAFEDECLANAERPVLFGAFQQERFYRQSEDRWQELARTAERTVVFADFEAGRAPADRPVESPLAADSPVRREWVLLCDGPNFSACVAGWEHPSRSGRRDRDRTFETVWTVDPVAVRSATRVGIELVRGVDPEGARRIDESLPGVGGGASADLIQATALFGRILDYAQGTGGDGDLVS